jgi:hypothetical protein
MADSLLGLVQIAAGFLVATALGFGACWWLLPPALRRNALVMAPAAGYALFCLAAVAISVNARISANAALWAALALLAVLSAGALVSAARSGGLRDAWVTARPALPSLAIMLGIVFWPVLYQGTSLYLGTANPDFYQSLAYHEVLSRFGIGALDPRPPLDYSLDPFFGTFPDPIPAKFGGVMFSMLLDKLFFMEPRAALMTALVIFLLCLPAAVYFFTRVVLEAGDRVSATAAVLTAISAPVTMSFIHVLVGQNSSLALMPLGLAIGFLAVRTRDWRLLLLAVLTLDAIFWIYVAILPYVGAPLAAYALYDLLRNRRGALRWLALAAGVFAASLLAIHLGMARESRQLVADIVGLLGRANRSVYVDFLTEMSLPYSVGLSSYPLGSSLPMTAARVPSASLVGFAMWYVAAAMLVLAFYFRALAAWARRAAPEPRAFVLATVAIYLAVWLYFNFVSLYGYAIFKMASWLQFLFVPVIAYGLVRFVAERGDRSAVGRLDTAAAAVIGTVLVVANLVSSMDFDLKGLGHDREKGAIVNSYGIGGNPDYPQLEPALARTLPPGAVVAIAAPDFIANLWTAYYVIRGGMKASFISHDDFPDEDVVLPDVRTGLVTNSANNTAVYKPRYHAQRPPYLLLEGPENLNREINDTQPAVAPLWSNGTFVLAEADKARDVLVTRRGFYRLEYFDPERYGWWWPDRMRWTPQGGEFLLIHASRPGEPHRLSFVAIAGKEREVARHIEVFLNGEKFDEQVVNTAARVVTKPFRPTGGVDRIVVKVRERVGLAPRNFGLWNRHIATDQRYLNLVVTQARILRGDEPARAAAAGKLTSRDIIDRSREFNGLSLDGWGSPALRVVLPVRDGAARARLRVQVPGWANFRFPLHVEAQVNGKRHAHDLAAAGAQVLEWPLEAGARELSLALDSGQSVQVPGSGAATFRIESLEIE